MTGGTEPSAEGSTIALPKGGGAVSGIGEKFTADRFTGTASFSVPIALPPGRPGATPELALSYGSGNGNGAFGLGWQLGVPGVSRRTARGVPRYRDEDSPAGPADVFVLAGMEDLVPVAGGAPGRARYRPRTEGGFARIEHVRDGTGDYWEVRDRSGGLVRYGTPRPAGADGQWRDPAAVTDPADPGRVFGWRVTESRDPIGNLIRYEYVRDQGREPGHRWDQPLPGRISYVDYGDPAAPSFLVRVDFDYERRPDPHSGYRAGFELRTTLRCRTIRVSTLAADGVERTSRQVRLGYTQAPFSGVSLLSRVDVDGVDGEQTESLPPLTFEYATFDPAGRRFEALTGPGLPVAVHTDPALSLVDMRGVGLPDIVRLGAGGQVWHNAGQGRFEAPRALPDAPAASPADPGTRLLDADGDGRQDLLVSAAPAGGALAGYFPGGGGGGWDRRSLRPYRRAPSVSLADPQVRLLDLDGDGLTDVLHSGTALHAWFNEPDPDLAWRRAVRTRTEGGRPTDLSDPRVRLADMTGDGLQDIVLLHNGNVAYWPNLGHGRWGERVNMRDSPRLPDRFDPRRVLLGDLDGDGVADLVYVERGRILLWGNRSGNGWTEQPVVITGTPAVVDTDAVSLADLHGTGMAGLLFSRAADGSGRHLRFLDPTGGVKPYLLTAMDNHLGAVTRVGYAPSTREFLRDQANPGTRWRTTLPFPVQVVSRVEVREAISGGRLTTEYRYHHGHWDGVEREFRGFAMVEQFDTETFGGSGEEHHSPPTLTRSWFHLGPVSVDGAGQWAELDLSHEYAAVDPPLLARPALAPGLARAARRDALRALRGQVLRTELYGLDGGDLVRRPYTVTEAAVGVRQVGAELVFFPFTAASRVTEWERGDEPMHRLTYSAGFDEYGLSAGELTIAVPRGRDPLSPMDGAGAPYLATYTVNGYARRDDQQRYQVDRVARSVGYEVVNDGRPTVPGLADAVLSGTLDGTGIELKMIADGRTYFDGDPFVGLALGTLGEHGLPVRVETLAFTDALLDELFEPGGDRPGYLTPAGQAQGYPPEFVAALPELAGYRRDSDTGGWYVLSERHEYDVHDPQRVPRGLPVACLDALGARSETGYDAHDLLPVRTVDAAGLSTEAVIDQRTLSVCEVVDANGNRSAVTFSPAGFVTGQYTRGRDGGGDLDEPGVRRSYDLLAYAERGEPAAVRTARRVYHDTDPDAPAGQRDDQILSVEFSDGLGRVVQRRSQAEDVLFGDAAFGGGVLAADQSAPAGDCLGRERDPQAPPNVAVSGWQVYDNKGRVVRAYEPFFAAGWDYAPVAEIPLGQATTTYYDPRGQVLRTVAPDGREQRTVFGVPVDVTDPDRYRPTAWESYHYDANDNAGRTHPQQAEAYRGHWNTPTSVEVDALGRGVRSVARTGTGPDDGLVTGSTFDILGNPVTVTDPLGRTAFRFTHDLLRRRWRVDGLDGGRRDTILDARGGPVEHRDAKGALVLRAFDRLHRPTLLWARDAAGEPVTLRQLVEYGDGGRPDQPAAERAEARSHNLLGRAVRHYDEAGLVRVYDVDLRGNELESERRVIADAALLAGYAAAEADGWRVPRFRVDWATAPGQTRDERDAELLEEAGYLTTAGFDALNRPTRRVLPADTEGRRREVRLSYNRAGALERVLLDGAEYVRRTAYDAKGQRTLIAYGNGTLTRYAYDPRTFRLVRQRSEPAVELPGPGYRPAGAVLQDLGYDYDLAGNVLAVRDRTPGSGIRGSSAALAEPDPLRRALIGSGDELERRFEYDPVYRLVSATGREHQAQPVGPPWTDVPRGTDETATQPYTQTYAYDVAGNLRTLAHAAAGGFTRQYIVEEATNRLVRLAVGDDSHEYQYDGSGNQLSESTVRHFAWNHDDLLASFATQTAGAEPSVHAQYLYDAAGQRVKKLVRRQGGAVMVTHYVGRVFEHHRWSGPGAGANNYLHVMDDQRRLAVLRVGDAHPDDRTPATSYHLSDHLDSATVVVDADGGPARREEFAPFGETTFGGFAGKRYRFTGRERDEESGLSYHGSRYYAPWAARWSGCDPAGLADGPNAYVYCRDNPLTYVDPAGTQAAPAAPAAAAPAAAKPERKDRAYWTGRALGAAGIDPRTWRPRAGFRQNEQTFLKVYEYYTSLYLADAKLKWAAMAKLAGGEVYRGYKHDIIPALEFGEALNSNRPSDAILTIGDLYTAYSGTLDIRLMQMQKEIFLDLAWQHQAYREGGLSALASARAGGELSPENFKAWQDIDSGDPARVSAGNKQLLRREQFDILQGYYKKIQDIPDYDMIPEMMSEDAQSPIPSGKPFQKVVRGGDITEFRDRWKWIETDMFPAFERLDPATLRGLVRKPLSELAAKKFK